MLIDRTQPDPSVADQKRRLLARILHERGLVRAASDPIRRRPDAADMPLSAAQERLWFLEQLRPGTALYNVPAAYRLRGVLDVEALRRGLIELVRRHEALRTRFVQLDGQPRQIVDHTPDLILELIDLRSVATDEREAALAERLHAAAHQPFDLEHGPLLRGRSCSRSRQTSTCCCWSCTTSPATAGPLAPLARDLTEAYAARCRGPAPDWTPLPVQYADYTLWQRELLGERRRPGQPVRRQLDYWKRQLSDLPELLPLPADRPRPAVPSWHGATSAWSSAPNCTPAWWSWRASSGTSLFMVLQAALAALCTRLGAGTDIPIGSADRGPHRRGAGRPDRLLRQHAGAAHGHSAATRPSASCWRGCGRPALAAYAHQDVPFEHLVEALNPARSLGPPPAVPGHAGRAERAGDASRCPAWTSPRTRSTPAPPSSTSREHRRAVRPGREPAGIAGAVEYATDLFDRSTVATPWPALDAPAGGRHRRPGPADRRDRPPGRRRARHRLLEWNATARRDRRGPVPQVFAAQVARDARTRWRWSSGTSS